MTKNGKSKFFFGKIGNCFGWNPKFLSPDPRFPRLRTRLTPLQTVTIVVHHHRLHVHHRHHQYYLYYEHRHHQHHYRQQQQQQQQRQLKITIIAFFITVVVINHNNFVIDHNNRPMMLVIVAISSRKHGSDYTTSLARKVLHKPFRMLTVFVKNGLKIDPKFLRNLWWEIT